ncbi:MULTISPECIES: hypothetical protein [Kitasatospora]|uniref:hypothetical protein n=1 Tax=Kitasatospora TaxID=2063 RepID=UPI000CAC0B6B|nr:hypothetical protein [Kitasatospora sp. GP30]MDH6145911.1 hypothetical protein [Kitasatospora sp. GP30]
MNITATETATAEQPVLVIENLDQPTDVALFTWCYQASQDGERVGGGCFTA